MKRFASLLFICLCLNISAQENFHIESSLFETETSEMFKNKAILFKLKFFGFGAEIKLDHRWTLDLNRRYTTMTVINQSGYAEIYPYTQTNIQPRLYFLVDDYSLLGRRELTHKAFNYIGFTYQIRSSESFLGTDLRYYTINIGRQKFITNSAYINFDLGIGINDNYIRSTRYISNGGIGWMF